LLGARSARDFSRPAAAAPRLFVVTSGLPCPVPLSLPLRAHPRRSSAARVRLTVVASAGTAVTRATNWGSESPPSPPSAGHLRTQYVVCLRLSQRQLRPDSSVRRSCRAARPASAVISGLAQADVAIAEVSSSSSSTVARKPAPVSRLARWSATRTTHFCAPTSPPP